LAEPSDLRAIRTAYDTVAVEYAEILRAELAARPVDRAMLTAFAELVQAAGARPVADIGCGPGRVTGYLHELGVTCFGIDLSPVMLALARRAYPALRFGEGSMSALGLADAALGGIVAWYSIIHTPPSRLPDVFAEFCRALRPGGYLLLAFQAGDDVVHLEQAYGHAVSLDAYRLQPGLVCGLISQAGLSVLARLVREPCESEKTQQAYLLARKPAQS